MLLGIEGQYPIDSIQKRIEVLAGQLIKPVPRRQGWIEAHDGLVPAVDVVQCSDPQLEESDFARNARAKLVENEETGQQQAQHQKDDGQVPREPKTFEVRDQRIAEVSEQ